MEIRKSGKVAILVIAALGTIGALHFLVFQERAVQYEQARQTFDQVRQSYGMQGPAPDIPRVNAFKYETLQKQLAYWEAVRDMDIAYPDFYGDFTAIDDRLLQQKFRDILDGLKEWRDRGEAGQGPQLTFLGERGWNFPRTLPEQIVQRGIAVEDIMTEIRNENHLLNSLDPQGNAFQLHSRIYANLLQRVGISEAVRDNLSERYGQVVATLYVLNGIDLVMEQLPDDFWQPGTSEDARLREMYRLLRLQWPVDMFEIESYLFHIRQGKSLLHMIEVAAEKDIEAITFVRLHEMRSIVWEPPREEGDEPEPDPMMGGEFWDPGMMWGMGEMGMGEMGEMGYWGGGRFDDMWGAGPQQPAEPTGEEMAFANPIEILVRGDNAAVMAFLYNLTNSRRPFELDRLRLRSEPRADAPVQALAFYNVITHANLIGAFKEEDVERKIVDTQRQLYDLAVRPGARELALQDGLVREIEGRWELTVDIPDPIPGEPIIFEEPQPSPDDIPGMEPGMPVGPDGMPMGAEGMPPEMFF